MKVDLEGQRSASAEESHDHVRRQEPPDCVRVDGWVGGRQMSILVDTGSNRTLVRSDVIPNMNLPSVPGGLCDVTGRRTGLRGPVEVDVTLGGQTSRQAVFVAEELEERCILGLDYLSANNCQLDLRRMTLQVHKATVPLKETQQDSPKTYRVVVRRQVRIPPRTEQLVECKSLDTMDGHQVLVEGTSGLADGIMVAKSLVKNESRLPILIGNLSNRHIRLKPGTIIGTGEDVSCGNVTVCGASSTHKRGVALPEAVQELLTRCSETLMDAQAKEVETLLFENSDIFSEGDHDLGSTDFAKHHIETNNHRPIKIPPRRIPLAKRDDAERLVSDMAQQGLIEKSASPWSSPLVMVKKKDG